MTLALRYAVRSDVGLLREGNEDSAYAGPRLLAVADGMGGHAAGEVASAVTIAAMAELGSARPGGDMLGELAAAVADANARLQEMIIANPAVEGMGTTLTAVFWSDGQAAVCHIGDSRGYLLRDGELYQITHDHTLVQSLVDEGRISADDVSTHPQRSLLLRALDGRSVAEPDLSVHDAQAGDRYLICSDGLSGVVSDETLRDTLASIEDPDGVARQLIELALRGGGPDNITCIVADVVDTATSRLAPTGIPVLAGAAAHDLDPRLGGSTGPLGRPGPLGGYPGLDGEFGAELDHHFGPQAAPLTAPQPALGMDDPDAGDLAPGPGRGRRGRARARPRRAQQSGRHWPIVTTALVVLLAVVAGGCYVAWRWTQDQYYVAADSKGDVVIYRGISQRVAGISLSSPYQLTGISLAQVPSQYYQTVKSTDAASSLADAREIVGTIRQAVSGCQQQYQALQAWAAAESAYQAEVNQAVKQKRPTRDIAKPGPRPAPAAAGCPPPAAFGIPASALGPAAGSP